MTENMDAKARSFSIEGRTRTKSDPETVMRYLLDPSTWHDWQPEISVAEGPAPLHKGDVVRGNARIVGFHDVEGRSAAVDVGEDFFEEEVVVGVGMRVRYEVRPDGTGAVVVHRLEAAMPSGWAGRLLSLMLRWRLRRLQKTALERLRDRAEAGEPV